MLTIILDHCDDDLRLKTPRERFVFCRIFEVDGRWLVQNEAFREGRKVGGKKR